MPYDKERDLAKMRKANAKFHQRRKELINSIKLATGCMDCGYREYPEALDFDHVRGQKICRVSTLLRCSMTRLFEEMSKCELVCANCHRVRHAKR